MTRGYVAMVLHSHMPFIRHPEIDDAMEERWLFEAINECYVPLIKSFDNLINDKIDFKITMNITPTLMNMLEDEYLNNRYMEYLQKSIELSEKEIVRTKDDEKLNKLSLYYNKRFKEILEIYENYECRLMNAFKKFDKLGSLEIITCAATHGLLPLLMTNRETVRAQIATGVQSYIECIGHAPKGIWLPECAYTYELDSILKEFGLKYFVMESTGILNASPRPRYGAYTPIAAPNGVCAFGRDLESSYQVWSNFMGYPGDYDYREFYKDIGYELEMDYIKPYINKDGIRLDTGIKYHRITGKTEDKEYYDREIALNKVKDHAEHFSYSRVKQIENIAGNMEQPPIILCPYDTELFGHWWFEGPEFIENFIRSSVKNKEIYELTTPSIYLEKNPVVQCCSPCPSTWGENGDFSVWLNPSNDWVYRDLHKCAEKMIRLANSYSKPTKTQKRVLNQAARELMLAEASDWPFIIKNNTTVQYAVKRINTHIERFNKLYEAITKDTIDLKYLAAIESLDNIFKNVNYEIYRSFRLAKSF